MNTLIYKKTNAQKTMKLFLSILTLVSLAICSPITAQEHSFPVGKYLVLMTDFDDDKPDESKMVMELNKDGILLALSPNKKHSSTPLAQLTLKGEKINIEFIPLLEDLSGDFTIEYLSEKKNELKNSQGSLLFSPFSTNEIGKIEMEIAEKWCMKKGDDELVLNFQLPNVVHVIKKENYIKAEGDFFWVSKENDNDISITASLFSSPFAGTLKQIQVKNNNLHFDYKGKHYQMERIN